MKTLTTRYCFGTLLTGLLLLTCASEGWSMPSFARKYRTSCTTCHEAFPKRNAVGEAFRLLGYRFVDDERYRKQEPVELGDEAYKRLWPKAIWPSTIPAQIPLSFVGRFLVEGDLDSSREDHVQFLVPEELELVVADSLGETVSFYGDVIYISKDFGGSDMESWVTAKGFLQFQSLLHSDNMFNLKVGTVGINGLALYTARDANNFTTHFYQYSTWAMPAVKINSPQSGLSDFKGNPFTLQPLAGIEVNGVGKRWLYTAGWVSSDVVNPVNEFPDEDFYVIGIGDRSPSDFFVQLAYKFGGLPLNGTWDEETNPLSASPYFWRDNHFMVSVFGHRGEAEIDVQDLAGKTRESTDEFWRVGVGAEGKYQDLTVNAGCMFGRDDNPYGVLSSDSVDSLAWWVEAYYFVYPWMIPYVRWEGLDLDLPSDVAGLNEFQDRARVIAGIKFMIRPNIALNVEGMFYTQGAELEEGMDNTLYVLLSAAF